MSATWCISSHLDFVCLNSPSEESKNVSKEVITICPRSISDVAGSHARLVDARCSAVHLHGLTRDGNVVDLIVMARGNRVFIDKHERATPTR